MITARRPSDRFCVRLGGRVSTRVGGGGAGRGGGPLADDAGVEAEPAEHVALALLDELDLLLERRLVQALAEARDDALACRARVRNASAGARGGGGRAADGPEIFMSMARPALAVAPAVKRKSRMVDAEVRVSPYGIDCGTASAGQLTHTSREARDSPD